MMNGQNGARRRRSAAQWAELIEAQAKSGVSQKTFCDSNGVSISSFVRALSKHRAASKVAKSAGRSEQFVPVTVAAPEEGHWELELQLGPSVVLRVRGH